MTLQAAVARASRRPNPNASPALGHEPAGACRWVNDLATLTRNTRVTAIAREQPFTLTARPTPIQQKARDLLGLSRTQ